MACFRTWTVVTKLSNYLGEREEIVGGNWNPDNMGSVVVADDADEATMHYKDTGVIVARATEAFADPTFWSMIGLIRILSNWLSALMFWCMSCP